MMRGAVAALMATLGGAASVGQAIDTFCEVVSAIPKSQLTGRKEDVEALNAKFAGMMATKLDCSVDPNNEVMGFNLKGVSFAECSAAEMKQQQAQTKLIGFATGGSAVCVEKIVDENANTAAVWMQMDSYVAGYHMRYKVATRFNMEGAKIASYHMLFDTHQIFALHELLIQKHEDPVLKTLALASASSVGTPAKQLTYSSHAGKAVQTFCEVMNAIPKGRFTGHKKDMEALMPKFAGMMSTKLDCSFDPNNEVLGFDLKGVSFAECSAAGVKQAQEQSEMIGFSTDAKVFCTEMIVDEKTNTAAAWMEMDGVVSGHHMRMRSATRFNMDGDKIAGYHTISDTYQIFALKEHLAKERAGEVFPQIALSSASLAGHVADAVCATFDALGRPQAYGGHDMEVVMAKFEGLFANKFDVSEDANNELLGFNLKGVTFEEFTAAKMKQTQIQSQMLGGMQTKWTMKCFDKIIDADTNSAALWLNLKQEDSQGNHLFNTRWAMRMKLEGGKIAGIHTVYDTYNLVALSEKMAQGQVHLLPGQARASALPALAAAVALPARASASPAGLAADALCATFVSLGHPQSTSPEAMKVTMAKFEGLFAAKIDASEDPNNERLGINLKQASFAEFQEAKLKQLQTQSQMLGGMQTKWSMECFDKIVDADTNSAALWLDMKQEDPQGYPLFNTRWAMRLNVQGGKIAGIHSVYDTFQLIALSEKMSGGKAATLSALASSWSSWAGVGAIAFLGAVAVGSFFKKKEQKSYSLLADETSA